MSTHICNKNIKMFKNKPSAQAKHVNSNPGIQKNGAKKEKKLVIV